MSSYNCPHCNRKYKRKSKFDSHTEQCVKVPQNKLQRNYEVKPVDTKKLLKCPVSGCNRKYKSDDRRKKHVEKDHFYETRKEKSKSIGLKAKARIYELAAEYAEVLYENDTDKMILCGKNLLPQKYDEEIESIELKRIVDAQQAFASKLFETNLLSICNWKKVMKDLGGLLKMGLPYYDTNFNPTLPIDFLWHSLMQDPELYKKICHQTIIPHCSMERTEEEDIQRYEYFLKVFRHKFKRDVYFPNTIPDTSSELNIEEIKQMFLDLSAKESEKIAAKEQVKREEQERRYREVEERELKWKLEEEKQNQELEAFFNETGVSVRNYYRLRYYIGGYNQGITGENLHQHVDKICFSDRSMASSC